MRGIDDSPDDREEVHGTMEVADHHGSVEEEVLGGRLGPHGDTTEEEDRRDNSPADGRSNDEEERVGCCS